MTNKRIAAVALTVAAACTLGASAATATTTPEDKAMRVSLTGEGRMHYAPSPADDVRIAFDAHATYDKWDDDPVPAKAGGRFRVSHHFADPGVTVWAEAKVDCVRAGGRVATVTAVVDRTSSNIADAWMGRRLGFTVVDLGRKGDQFGQIGPREDVSRCMTGKPFTSPTPYNLMREGGFKLKHNLPALS